VPVFNSSEKDFMVIAGAKNIKTHGATINNVSILAYPASKTLKSPGKTHIKSPMVVIKTTITMYPINEFKKLKISFLRSVIIFL
jgi:hypothetical protein